MTAAERFPDIVAHAPNHDDCPYCSQRVASYRRSIGSTMSRFLIWLEKHDRRSPGQWVDVRKAPVRGGDYAKLALWGLIEQHPTDGVDNAGRSGLWRVTALGSSFANNFVTVEKYAIVFLGEPQRFEGPHVSIIDTLGAQFDYQELIGGSE
jgi:hypothetical protein